MPFSPLLFQFFPIIQGRVGLGLEESPLAELKGEGEIQAPLFNAKSVGLEGKGAAG